MSKTAIMEVGAKKRNFQNRTLNMASSLHLNCQSVGANHVVSGTSSFTAMALSFLKISHCIVLRVAVFTWTAVQHTVLVCTYL
jgi:hypothetical protein